MSRPSFQFYPGDWQKNANLRRCSPAARGVWMDILCLLHDSETEYGVLRWPLKDIANAASAPLTLVRELVSKGVLKGADKGAEPYVYRPKHAGKVGEPVILVTPLEGPVWYSSRFVRDEYVRQRRGESTRFDTANQPTSRSPKGGIGDRQGDGPSSSSSSSPSGNTSEAIASGGDLPPSPPPQAPPFAESEAVTSKDVVFALGVPLLTAAGVAEKNARSFLAMQCKLHTDSKVAEALRQCATAQALQPIPWLQDHLGGKAARGHNRQEAQEARNAAAAQEWLAEQGVGT